MKRIAAWFAVIQLAILAAPAFGQQWIGNHGGVRIVTTESWVEEWDSDSGRWVRVSEGADAPHSAELRAVSAPRFKGRAIEQSHAAARYARPTYHQSPVVALAQYGPFVVTDPTRAALIGSTDSSSPRHFDAMLRDFPNLAVLDMIEAPGTSNDIANLAVGRRIRAAGIATHVPRGGSVRSGAVELFLAGAHRSLEDGAQFAVHSWLDNYGREATDFAANDPTHRLYLDYYVEMGMSEARARAFYSMTNSVPHASALWLRADDMREWLRPERPFPATTGSSSSVVGSIARAALTLKPAGPYPDAVSAAPKIASLEIGYSDIITVSLAQLDIASLDSRRAFP